MTSRLVDALALPATTRVAHRVAKKELASHGAVSAADRRLIEHGVEEIQWVAALKPSNTGVLPYTDVAHDYGEIVVVSARLRGTTRSGRLITLLQRAVPYPLVLCIEHEGTERLALAHKRRARSATSAPVVEELRVTAPVPHAGRTAVHEAFLASLGFTSQPSSDLLALYQGWIDRAVALDAAAITGAFSLVSTASARDARRDALAAHHRLAREVQRLRREAARERQLARRVELNQLIKRIEADLAAADRLL